MAFYFSIEDIFHQPDLPVDVFRVVHDEPMPEHGHEFSELVLVTRGEAVHVVDESEQLIMMGDVFVIRPGMIHGYENVKKLELINVLFYDSLLNLPAGYEDRIPKEVSSFLWSESRKSTGENGTDVSESHLKLNTDQLVSAHELIRELEEAAFSTQNIGTVCVVTSCLMRIFGMLLKWSVGANTSSESPDYQISRAFTYIAENFAAHVTLADLTKRSGMSESSLTRAFRKMSGLTPIEYLISYRIKQSCRLLQYTEKNVTEIAFECGFSDSNYFSRKFHDLTDLTPLQFRKQSRSRKAPFDAVLPQPSESDIKTSRR